jgi:hypothetical protein
MIPRAGFDAAVRKHQAGRNAKGFTCWGQFVAMLLCQLGSVNIVLLRQQLFVYRDLW